MKVFLVVLLFVAVLSASQAFATYWTATPTGMGAGGVVLVRVQLVSDLARTGCGGTPCYTSMWVELNVFPSVFGTTRYSFNSPADAVTTGVELPLLPGITYYFSGCYAWTDFRPEITGACAEIACQGQVNTPTLEFTPTPLPVRPSTWGAIKALFR